MDIIVSQIKYELGLYMGEIMIPQLPMLSIDGGEIQVTWGEAQEYARLDDAWFDAVSLKEEDKPPKEVTDALWNANLTERYRLKEKYLPHEKEFYLTQVNLDYLEYIKKGIRESLYHSDICDYDIDNIQIKNHRDFTIVTLQLNLNIPLKTN